MRYEQAFNLKPNTDGIFDIEKSKEQVKILVSTYLPGLLQVFSTITALFKHLVSSLS